MANPEPNTGFYDNPFRETQGFQHLTDNINQSIRVLCGLPITITWVLT